MFTTFEPPMRARNRLDAGSARNPTHALNPIPASVAILHCGHQPRARLRQPPPRAGEGSTTEPVGDPAPGRPLTLARRLAARGSQPICSASASSSSLMHSGGVTQLRVRALPYQDGIYETAHMGLQFDVRAGDW